MLSIFIARHGQDEDNVKGVLNGRRDRPLTELGRSQASELGEKIKSLGIAIDKVYTSPLKRAYETAQIICGKIGVPEPFVEKDLIERDFGIMTGKSHQDIERYCYPNVLKTPTVTYFLSPHGAETFPDLVKRGGRVLAKINKLHKSGNILLVCHGDIGKMIYASYYHLDWKDFLPKFHFGNSDLLIMSPDSPPEFTHVYQKEQNNL